MRVWTSGGVSSRKCFRKNASRASGEQPARTPAAASPTAVRKSRRLSPSGVSSASSPPAAQRFSSAGVRGITILLFDAGSTLVTARRDGRVRRP